MNTRRSLLTFLLIGFAMSSSHAQELDRSKRPLPQPAPEVHLPTIQKATLPDGLAVWLVEKHELPTVAFNMVILAGSDHDPAELPGLAAMTAEVMQSGCTGMDALTIAERLDFIGAAMDIRTGTDASFAVLQTLTKHLDDALAVYSQVLASPTFPAAEIERIRAQRLTALLQQKDRASSTANIVFNKIVYGKHPYGADPSGTEASLKAISAETLRKFYNDYFRPNNATLIVVGDIVMPALLQKLTGAFASWQGASVSGTVFPALQPIQTMQVYLVDKPKAPQSEIRIGYPALARSTPDFFPVVVMNRILGGQFSSRINMNLRERHGFTYGARSSFVFTKQPGPFTASGGFVSTKTDSSIHELLTEINGVCKDGITPDELEFSKKGLMGSFAQSFETQSQIAMALQNLVLYGLPDDYFQNYLKNIEAVTLSDVKRVASAYLNTSGMAIVVVGDVKEIRPGIEHLGLGPISICNSEGNVVGR